MSVRFAIAVANASRLMLAVIAPVVGVIVGFWVYRDAKRRDRHELAPIVGAGIGLVFLSGSVPALVALVVAPNPTVQGFPTALRIVPGLVAFGGYLLLRDRLGG